MSSLPNRRSFLQTAVSAGIVTAGAGMVPKAARAQSGSNTLGAGDVAILKFLAAVELVETDLWTQYSELAVGNPGFNQALKNIDPSLVRYNMDIRRDEMSHALYINAGLKFYGQTPVNLDAFRTLKMPQVAGADNLGHLTNLTDLTVDTSWYVKYRTTDNPDFGVTPPQLVNIVNRPGIPLSDGLSDDEYQAIANTATFHSPSIEQTGVSIYDYFLTQASNLNVVATLASILPVEAIHLTGFHKSLETLPGVSVDGLTFPDLRSDRQYSEGIYPTPCPFLTTALPDVSVVRPRTKPNAGAVHLVTAIVKSGLFKGQSNEFLDNTMALAVAADSAYRMG